jgi:RNA polymerase primary sigma factor
LSAAEHRVPAPARLLFTDRLRSAAAAAAARGMLESHAYDSLLVDPDFDEAAFEEFRRSLLAAGVMLPEEEGEAAVQAVAARADRGDPERDLLQRYLDEIGRFPVLPHEQVLRIAARVQAGDPEARKQLILANLRLVVHTARRYRDRGLPFLDLIEDGNIGLIQAVDRFDPARGVRFSTYATLWIRQAIVRGLAEQSRAVRIPVQLFQQMNRFVRTERALTMTLGRPPLPAEVGHAMGLPVDRVDRLAALVDRTRTEDPGEGVDAFEELAHEDHAPGVLSVERIVELQLQHEQVDRLLRTLSQRESQLLRIRYGFVDGVGRTLQETGEHFGITRERVRQIETRALEKLRQTITLAEQEAERHLLRAPTGSPS